MSLPIVLTAAGRAALVNAPNTGTQTILVSKIGVTATAFVPNSQQTSIPGELKQLSTFAGAAVADDTIHVTLRDDSADTYSMRGFGLYLEDGTLFAAYGQPAVILEKSQQALLLLSADIRFVGLDVTSIVFGDASFMNPPATSSTVGVVRLATVPESVLGEDAATAVPPAGLKAVLDGRLGAGAPSAFVKTLLGIASAALLRTALELGNAALKNQGAGNGLDADKLDGQEGVYYLDWNNLGNRPASYPPSAHSHAATEITTGTFANARIAVGNVTQHQAALAIAWTQITGKPVTFAPSAHTHDAGDIASGTFPDGRVAQSNVTQHQAALAIGWSQVTGKPVTFPPSAHGHVVTDVAGLQAALNDRLSRTETGYVRAGSNLVTLTWNSGALEMKIDTTVQGSLWHSGNLNPALYAPLASPSFTGVPIVTEGTLQVGSGAGFIRLRFDGAIAINSTTVFSTLWHGGNFNPASKQNTLGFIPVQQGTGVGQAANVIKIGWGGGQLLATVDSTNLGPFAFLGGSAFTGNISAPAVLTNAIRPSGPQGFQMAWNVSGGGGETCFINNRGTGPGGFSWYNRSDEGQAVGNPLLFLANTGALTAAGGFTNGSSRLLKTALRRMPYGLADVEKIEVKIGRYRKRFNRDGRDRLFVIAEQLVDVIPEAVFEDGAKMGKHSYPTVEYTQLIPVLIRAVQELSQQIRTMQGDRP